MALPRFLLISALSMMLLYGLSVMVSTAAYRGFGLDQQLDTGSRASDLAFGGLGASAVVYNRHPLIRNGPQVILIGSSNFQHYSANAIASEMPGISASNMAVEGSNLADFELVVNLAYEVLPASSSDRHTFVFGLWYGEFFTGDGVGHEGLNSELTRYGLYQKVEDDRAILKIPRSTLPVAVATLRPLIIMQRAWEPLTAVSTSVVKDILGQPHPPAIDLAAQDQAESLGEAEKRVLIERRSADGTRVGDDVLAKLMPIAKRISDAGDRLVLVDLPLPRWHAEAVPAASDYSRRKQAHFAALLRLPGVYYLDMEGSATDEDFYDSVYLRPKACIGLAHQLGRALAGLTGPGETGIRLLKLDPSHSEPAKSQRSFSSGAGSKPEIGNADVNTDVNTDSRLVLR